MLARAGPCDVAPAELDRAAQLRLWHESGQSFNQFRLPVALDPRDADDLAGANVERDAAHSALAARPDGKVLYSEHHSARLSVRLLDAEQNVAPDHHARQFGSVRLLRLHATD